jgi:hypothetical protein
MKAHEVIRYAGITYRQLDHWTREQHVRCPPTGSGNFRDYKPKEVAVAWWMARLTEAGVQYLAAARIARSIAYRGRPAGDLVPLPGGFSLSVLGVAPPRRRRV